MTTITSDPVRLAPNDVFDLQAELAIHDMFELFKADWSFCNDLREFVNTGEFDDVLDCLKNAHAVAQGFDSADIVAAHNGGKKKVKQLVSDARQDAPLNDLVARWETLLERERDLNLDFPVFKVKKFKKK